MPTYRYRCGKCDEDFETWQSIKDDSLTTHAEAGCGGTLVKVLSPAGIVLKGSGFYKTDNRANGKSSTDSASSAESGSSESGSGSSDAKPSDATSSGSSDSGSSTKDSSPSSSGSKGSDSKASSGSGGSGSGSS